jgi:hypothetical protein
LKIPANEPSISCRWGYEISSHGFGKIY